MPQNTLPEPSGLDLAAITAHAAATLQPRTWALYVSDLRDLERAVPGCPRAWDGPAEWSEIMTAWRNDMQRRRLAPRTIARRMAAARAMHRAARALGMISWDAPRILVPKASATWATMPAPWDRLVGIVDALEASEQWPRALAWHLGLFLGLRRSEIARAAWHDVTDLGGRPALRVRRKGGRLDVIPMPARTMDTARAAAPDGRGPMIRGRHGRAIGPETIARWIAADGAAHGIRIRAHDLRRAALTMAMRISHAPELVAQLAGHRNVGTTSRYLAGNPEALAGLVEALASERGQLPLAFERREQ